MALHELSGLNIFVKIERIAKFDNMYSKETTYHNPRIILTAPFMSVYFLPSLSGRTSSKFNKPISNCCNESAALL